MGNGAPPEFNQSNSYDFAGRLKYNGAGPLGQWLKYDAFNNLTERQNSFYEYEDRFEAVYANNRKAYGIGGGYDYHDKAGNVVHSHFQPYVGIGNRPFIDDKKWTFDAAGRMSYFTQFTTADVPYTSARETKSTLSFDGDGRLVKDDNYFRDCGVAEEPDECTGEWLGGATHYLVSSVTGQKITMVGDGENGGQSVFLGATKVAAYFESNQPNFTLTDPITGSTAPMGSDGTVHDHVRTELAAFGTAVPLYAPPSFPGGEVFEGTGNPGDSEWGCKDEFGDPEPCSFWNIYHHSNQVDAAKKRRIYKEPLGIVDSRRLPRLPYDETPRGPATGLAAGYLVASAFEVHGREDPSPLITADVTVNISDPFEGRSAESGFAGTNDSKLFRSAVRRVREILARNPDGSLNDCAKFFNKSAGALKALDAFEAKAKVGTVGGPQNRTTGIQQKTTKDRPMEQYDAAGNPFIAGKSSGKAAYRVFGQITINTAGPFMSAFANGNIGNYPDAGIRSRVLQVLHELAHVSLDSQGRPLIADDGDNKKLSETNTALIKDACKKEIEASGE